MTTAWRWKPRCGPWRPIPARRTTPSCCAMTAAEALRPADRQGSWPARELRSKALESLKSPLSSEFRTKLAEAVAPRFEKFDAHDPIRDFFNAADPLSCGAQIVIYANANTSRETRSRFDQQFAGFSTIALSRLMGLVDEAPPGSLAPSAAKPSDVDAENQLAALLWSERFRAVFDPQVEDSAILGQATPNCVAGERHAG